MDSYSVSAIFSATVKPFLSGVSEASSAIKGFESQVSLSASGISSAIGGIGKGLTLGLTIPLAAAAGAGIKSAISFESAFAGVRKTVDATEEEFAALSKGIRNMATEIPAAATEIAGVAEVAGQLGIKTGDIMKFTETMIQLGTATNMSAEEAATQLARLANITQMPMTEIDKLGSTVVALGNNLATTESEIVQMGLRLSGTGAQVGLTEAQILSMAGAMSSVGVNAEAGGSAMSRVLQKINTEVLSSGEKLEGFASVAGMSAQEFSSAWKKDPQAAIIAFIEGLGSANNKGLDTVSMLKELGISGIREVDTLNRLSGAGTLLADSFQVGNKAWEENIALTKEAEERYKTMESQLTVIKNNFKEAAMTIGESVMPAFKNLSEKVGELAKWFNNLSPSQKELIVNAGLILAAIGPILLIISKLISVGVALVPVFKAIGAVFALVATPIGAVVAVVAALVAGLLYLWSSNEGFREAMIAIWTAIKDFIVNAIETIKTTASNIWEGVKELWTAAGESLKAIWTGIQEFFVGLWEGIKLGAETGWTAFSESVMAVVTPIVESIQNAFETLTTVLSGIWENIKVIASNLWELIKNVIIGPVLVLLQILTGDWEGAKESLKQIWENIKTAAKNIWESIKSIVSDLVNSLVSAVKSAWENLKSTLSNILDSIKSTMSNVWNSIKDNVSGTVDSIKESISNGFQSAKDKASELATSLKDNVSDAFTAMVDFVTVTVPQIPSKVGEAFSDAISRASNFFGQAVSVGGDLIMGFVNGVRDMAGNLIAAVGDAINGAINWAKSLLGIGSPSKLFKKFGAWTDEGLAIGINKNAGAPVKAMNGMVAGVIGAYESEEMNFSNRMGNLNGSFQSVVDHKLSDNASAAHPATLILKLGSRSFKAFVEDMTNAQNESVELKEIYEI